MGRIKAGKLLLLTPFAFTATEVQHYDAPNSSWDLTVFVQAEKHWAGSPLGGSNQPGWPIAWTPSMLAATNGLSVADYLATQTTVNPNAYLGQKNGLLRVPRALLFSAPTDALATIVKEALAGIAVELGQANVLAAPGFQTGQGGLFNLTLPPANYLVVNDQAQQNGQHDPSVETFNPETGWHFNPGWDGTGSTATHYLPCPVMSPGEWDAGEVLYIEMEDAGDLSSLGGMLWGKLQVFQNYLGQTAQELGAEGASYGRCRRLKFFAASSGDTGVDAQVVGLVQGAVGQCAASDADSSYVQNYYPTSHLADQAEDITRVIQGQATDFFGL